MLFPGVTRAGADVLDQRLERSMGQAGGPPPGLMVHIGRPTDDGLLITDVWRTEDEWQGFLDGVLLPLAKECGIQANEPTIAPVWQFGRP